MNLDWGRLKILDAVARTGSVRQAAELLHMTPPAVSQQLRRIETECHVTVVAPEGRGLRLTFEGQILADYAARVADLMQQAARDVCQDNGLVGNVRLGGLASIIRGSLADTVAQFQRDHPRVTVRLADGETMDHLNLLSRGLLDIVLAESWSVAPTILPEGIHAEILTTESVSLALPEGHRLSAQAEISWDQLSQEVWTTCAEGSNAHRTLTRAAELDGVRLDVRHHVADHETQLALVASGLAVACIPESAWASAPQGVLRRELTNHSFFRDILLVTGDRAPSAPSEAMIARLSSAATEGDTN